MKAVEWLKRKVGELGNWRPVARMKSGRLISAYSLDSARRVDYQLAQELYYNENDNYKLGAAFAKPIVNTAVGFMGVPTFRLADEDGEALLRDFAANNVSRFQRTHRDGLRDGDCYVWITREEVGDNSLYPDQEYRLKYNIIPPGNVEAVNRNVVTGVPLEYIIRSTHSWTDSDGNEETSTVLQRITPDTREVEVGDGQIPTGLEEGTFDNPWGFIPIVHFVNELEEDNDQGRSDFEGVEPFIKAYHDVFRHAVQGSKLHSTPRLKMHVRDIESFLAINFGVDDPQKFVNEGRTINLENKDLLIFSDENEDAQFIEVSSAIGAAEPLLHLLFYCIVEQSETPEFAFGAHLPANYASVKEQMPILIRRVARKREFFEEPWKRVGRMVLAMNAAAENRRYETHEVGLQWDEIDPRDSKDVAEELRSTVSALTDALEHNIISHESAVDYLNRYIDTMSPYRSLDEERPGERDKIVRSLSLMNRLEDREQLMEELERLEEELEGVA